jgi:hypothetical protein
VSSSTLLKSASMILVSSARILASASDTSNLHHYFIS